MFLTLTLCNYMWNEILGFITDLIYTGRVWQVAWAHPKYGNLLASCSYDRKVLIWQEDGHTWRKIHDYSNHTSSDLFTCSHVYLRVDRIRRPLEAPIKSFQIFVLLILPSIPSVKRSSRRPLETVFLLIHSICWAPHEYGLILACASSDGSVSTLTYTSAHTWEAKKINNAHNFGCNAVSWAPASAASSTDGANPSGLSNPRIVTGGCDNCVKIWRQDSQTGEWSEEAKLERHLDWVRDVAWAPSIGLPRSMIASCSQDRHVTIWVNEGSTSQWHPKDLGRFDDVIWHVSWSITGDILAISGGDNKF
ncbi:Protein SEC13-like protein [Armadillidium vulgare]|nr:Protein SEC13-like protein [Armadillidium vulgare]